MTDLDKAREWAERWGCHTVPTDTRAVIDLVQSLPDQLVDVEKLKTIIADMDHCLKMKSTTDFSKGIDNATTSWRDALKALITPKLPTLADMTTEERAACQWMQARVETDERADIGVISTIWRDRAALIYPSGFTGSAENWRITPLPDLPKLQWPGGVVDCEIVDESPDDQAVAKDVCNSESNSSETPKSSIKPEDVPAGEPWLIEADGQKAIGTRYKGDTDVPWSVASLDGEFAGDHSDNEVTLIHKLVPEPPALPEGMRLADHEEYGRIIVSPGTDQEDDYLVFHSEKDVLYGASWGYLHDHEFTYVDGDQHA